MNEHIAAMLADRIRRIKETVASFDAGELPATKAVSRIEEIAAGEDERIVHVGNSTHKPEVQS